MARTLSRRTVLAGLATSPLWAGCAVAPRRAASPAKPYAWTKLTTEPYKGKQDDVFFVDADTGWYVNGAGRIFHTGDGGASWTPQLEKPGTYFRCIGFVDENVGYAGNIGTDYFPGVTDTQPLYGTSDGGKTWAAVTAIEGPAPKGLCAIHVLRNRFINAGTLAERSIINAAGRVGGPAYLLRSVDGGKTWRSTDLGAHCAMILDVHFFNANDGVICAGSDADVEKSNALVLTTSDGGATWTQRYRSARPFELTWKCAFPSRNVGYVTVQNYDPDPKVTQRVVAKTDDGGLTWKELPLVDDAKVRQFGVGFVDETTGWVGAIDGGFETGDGGATWKHVAMGQAVNKIRILNTDRGVVGYAIGKELFKLDAR